MYNTKSLLPRNGKFRDLGPRYGMGRGKREKGSDDANSVIGFARPGGRSQAWEPWERHCISSTVCVNVARGCDGKRSVTAPEVVTSFGIPVAVYYVAVAGAGLTVVIVICKALYSWGKWVQSVNEAKRTLDGFVVEIRKDIKELLGQLAGTVARGSPLRLTDLGMTGSDGVEARRWAERIAKGLYPRVQGKQPYQVQEFCFDYVNEEYKPDPELDAKIGACAYDQGISRERVLEVLVVELRDKLLEDL